MVRTQIQLTEAQAAILKRMAARQRKPIAALIREAIDQMMDSGASSDRQARLEKARAAAGKFGSGSHDLSANHDRYLTEAFNS